ncbi:expressed unknown protein [Seminavis robusta]|uniref:Uncharacterized protein n=1 Tax=Seminavis robusta TaxID=568900 RepID=A0A9N8D770_9STRA|nr:expressed unknown protein [Seminavis robusta]|eukprot:Sro23_g016170.1 n/a (216) ;mRNA; f:171090-171737
MVLHRLCRELLNEKDSQCKEKLSFHQVLLEQKDAQCKESHSITKQLLEEKEVMCTQSRDLSQRLLEDQGHHLEEVRLSTRDCLRNDRDLYLKDWQNAMEQQQQLMSMIAVVAGVLVFALVALVFYSFNTQGKEKRQLNLQYERAIQEKTDRIVQLEKLREEQSKSDSLEGSAALPVTQLPQPQMQFPQPQMPPFVFTLPSSPMPTMALTTPMKVG